MAYKYKLLVSGGLVALLSGFLFFLFLSPIKVFGNQFFFPQVARTATATTSVSYMTPGTATTTVVYDSWGRSGSNQTDIGQTMGADGAVLLLQLTASSSLSVLGITYEYSTDGIDYYQDNLFSASTSTLGAYIVTTRNSLSWTYASSTVGGAALGANTATSTKAFTVPTPTRFVRAVLTLTGANAAVWAAIVPKNQRAQ